MFKSGYFSSSLTLKNCLMQQRKNDILQKKDGSMNKLLLTDDAKKKCLSR